MAGKLNRFNWQPMGNGMNTAAAERPKTGWSSKRISETKYSDGGDSLCASVHRAYCLWHRRKYGRAADPVDMHIIERPAALESYISALYENFEL